MATELQDAADRLANRIPLEPGDREILVEAARRVANPDYEAFHKALYEWYHSERPMSPDVEKELLNAALGVTEDTPLMGSDLPPRRPGTVAIEDITEDV